MDKSILVLRRVAAFAFALASVAVFILSLAPGKEMPSLDVWDKGQHFVAYLALGGLGALACWRPDRRMDLPLLLFLIAMGGGLEFGQASSPGRSAEVSDAVANTVGACAGIFLLRSVFMPLYLAGLRRARARRPQVRR